MIYIYITLAILLLETSYLVLVNQKKLATGQSRRNVYVDTSVLIDGRIIDVARTNFIDGTLQIPKSVVAELQLLADGTDNEKRSRARYGLDVIAELQALDDVEVNILQDKKEHNIGVDDQLVILAKKDSNSAICTLDYNLNKVASVDGVQVLNINDLALSLRVKYLPGDNIEVELTHRGQEANQAIGSTEDGTMVVVEKAGKRIGESVKIEVVRSLQTAAGRMIFGKIVQSIKKDSKNPNSKNVQKNIAKNTAKVRATAKVVNGKTTKRATKPKTQEDKLLELVDKQ